MKDVHRSWGQKIKARRRALGMTQAHLAELATTTQASISRIERGDQPPGDDLKWRLAGALGETVERLFQYPAVRPPMREESVA
jgi:transcriptional regulator with XRE-family HTH domain